MELNDALTIMRNLSEGIDPETNQPLPKDSIYQRPAIIRALCTAVDVMGHLERKRERKLHLPSNTGKPWTREEEVEICHEFGRAGNVFSIAKHHERTVGSIAARLVKLGKMSPDDLPRFVGPAKASRIIDYETASKASVPEEPATRVPSQKAS